MNTGPDTAPLRLRNSAKAYIVRGDRLLLVKCVDAHGAWYTLPGGGMNPGETLHEALRRECREEIGAEIVIRDLIAIREYIAPNHEFANFDACDHQIEFMFACRVAEDYVPARGHDADSAQTGVVWMPLESVESVRLYPMAMRSFFARPGEMAGCRYFGDIN